MLPETQICHSQSDVLCRQLIFSQIPELPTLSFPPVALCIVAERFSAPLVLSTSPIIDLPVTLCKHDLPCRRNARNPLTVYMLPYVVSSEGPLGSNAGKTVALWQEVQPLVTLLSAERKYNIQQVFTILTILSMASWEGSWTLLCLNTTMVAYYHMCITVRKSSNSKSKL